MKKLLLVVVAVLAAAVVLFSGNPACAYDTSPYLIGVWDASYITSPTTIVVETKWDIVNPTSSAITYCCCVYNPDSSLAGCLKKDIYPNEHSRHFYYISPYENGVLKCIAVPQGKWVFDPNVVIGGFIINEKTIGAKYPWDSGALFYTETKRNMEAVVINSKTLPEFNQAMQACRNTPF